jgi:hypothetical protein
MMPWFSGQYAGEQHHSSQLESRARLTPLAAIVDCGSGRMCREIRSYNGMGTGSGYLLNRAPDAGLSHVVISYDDLMD